MAKLTVYGHIKTNVYFGLIKKGKTQDSHDGAG